MASKASDDRLLYRIREVAEITSLSIRTIQRLIALGELERVKCGRATRVTAESVRKFIEKGGTKA